MATKRERAGAKKLDLGIIRQAMLDSRVWTGMGVVRQFDGESSHFEIDTTTGVADVLVDVELAPNGERLVCRLGVPGGVWRIPAVGTEVAILVPEGDFDADAIIVAELSTGNVAGGLGASTTVILAPAAGGQVLVYDGNDPADAVELATKQDVQDLKNYVATFRQMFDAHVHSGGTLSGGLTGISGTVMGTDPADPNGTACLKGQ